MFLPAILFLSLAAQQPTQQPAVAAAKPQTNASQQADTSKKAKHKSRSRKAKAKPAAPAAAPRDTTKKP